MNPFKATKRRSPEAKVQNSISNMLTLKGWYVRATHGSMYQCGFPDLFACHSSYGHRWIEVKLPRMKGSKFTPAQLDQFPKMCANGSGVWVLVNDSEDEYLKLFKKFNWYTYLEIMK